MLDEDGVVCLVVPDVGGVGPGGHQRLGGARAVVQLAGWGALAGTLRHGCAQVDLVVFAGASCAGQDIENMYLY